MAINSNYAQIGVNNSINKQKQQTSFGISPKEFMDLVPSDRLLAKASNKVCKEGDVLIIRKIGGPTPDTREVQAINTSKPYNKSLSALRCCRFRL
ncbi:MAG: hypothetical protein MZU97_09395 [Bacillus subtilis]|nr:hypothetical protein [Bacillus subtilis]